MDWEKQTESDCFLCSPAEMMLVEPNAVINSKCRAQIPGERQRILCRQNCHRQFFFCIWVMGLSNGPGHAVCTECYGVKANETLHPSWHKTLSLFCSCEHLRHVLIELWLLVKALWRRLQTSSEVSVTSWVSEPIQLSKPLYTSANEDFFFWRNLMEIPPSVL